MERFPELYTNRLKLRKIRIEDVPSLVKYANNKKVSDNIVNMSYPYREPDAVFRISYVVQGFKNKTRFVFAIILKENEEFIGEISLHLMDKGNPHAQLAYWLGEPFWNNGITTEAARAVLKYGFETLNLELIYADCYTENKVSEKVMQIIGMKKHSGKENLLLYKITKPEYEKQYTGAT